MGVVATNYHRKEFRTYADFEQQVSDITEGKECWLFRGQGVCALPQPRFLRGQNAKRNADELESQFIEHFHNDLGRSFPRNSFSKWRVLTWLQHYGAPTRLLDWTKDSLVALWFAASARLSEIEAGKSNQSTAATVWIVRVSAAEWLPLDEQNCPAPSEISESRFIVPPEIDARVVAQKSVFSAHRLPRSSLDCVTGLWPDWDPKLKSGGLFALSCDDQVLSTLFSSLKENGRTRRSIFPDLERVSDDLNRKYLAAPDLYLVRSGITLPAKSKKK